MMKKKFTLVLACLLIVMMGLVGCSKPASTRGDIKNVIVMIGDGFGPNHLANAKKYFDVDKFAFEDHYVCDVTTYSKDSNITDSAAAATALATGQKVNNGEIGRHQAQDIENLMEIAIKQGKKTGVLTSDSLCGATPASFSAHTDGRDYVPYADEMAQDQCKSGIDIFIGERAGVYDENYFSFFQRDYVYETDNSSILNQLDHNEKYILQYSDLKAEYNHNLENSSADWVDYPALITDVLGYLDNENGFCLMIENGYIDKYSHNNNFVSTMHEVMYFAQMIEAVYQFCAGRDDTVVMITADHETGGLQLGNTKESLTDELYTSDGHTATNVNLFIKYAVDHKQKNYSAVIDNTDIFRLGKQLLEQGTFNFDLLS